MQLIDLAAASRFFFTFQTRVCKFDSFLQLVSSFLLRSLVQQKGQSHLSRLLDILAQNFHHFQQLFTPSHTHKPNINTLTLHKTCKTRGKVANSHRAIHQTLFSLICFSLSHLLCVCFFVFTLTHSKPCFSFFKLADVVVVVARCTLWVFLLALGW